MYRMLVAVVCLCLPLLLTAEPATPLLWSERSFYHGIEEIPVYGRNEGSLTQLDLEAARARLRERAGGTAVIDGEALRDRRVNTLSDALGFAPGVFVQPRFGSEEARLSIRGSGLQRTFHLRGVRLLQDGVPVGEADGGGEFQALEMLSARHIEVYRGASALEYGAATLGGAINFVSPTGHNVAPLSARLEGGSFDYHRGQLALAGVSGPWDGYASFSGYRQDGFRDQAVQESYRLFSNLGYRFSNTLEGRFYLTRVDSRSQLPGNLTRVRLADNPAQANPVNALFNWRRDMDYTRLAARLAWMPAAGQQLTVSAYVVDKSLDHPIFQVLLIDTRDAGVSLHYRHEGSLGHRRNVLLAGLNGSRGEVEDRRFVNTANGRGAPTARAERTAKNLEVFVENQFSLTERLVLIGGVQGLRSLRDSDDHFQAGGVDRSFDRTWHAASPRLGLRHQTSEAAQLFANVSRSYEPPTFGEMAGGPNVTPVDAQRAISAELGARIETPSLSLDIAGYRAWLKKELLALTDGQGNPLGTVNAGDTLHQGLELGLVWRPLVALAVSANYLYNDFRFDGDRVFGNNDLAGVPPHHLRLEVKYALPGNIYIAPHLEWSPRPSFVDHANTVSSSGYSIYGMRVGGALGAQLSWFVDGRNLGDRRYVSTTAVVADANGADGAYFLPGDGRAVYAGIEWRM